MKVADFCKSYFHGFQDVSNCKKNNAKSNVLAVIKILSYFTVVIPLGCAVVYGADSCLRGRVSRKEPLSSHHEDIFQTSDSKVVRSYTGDLTLSEKLTMQASLVDDNHLSINFQGLSDLNLSIRRQDLFESGAQVIINAANTHLGGGGGIDGEIHEKGGAKYKKAHRGLKKLYKSKYVSGHAAMIESGLLKGKGIQNVIVVAGPSGSNTPANESELYSCYFNSLMLAENQGKTSIAFPSISTGRFGYPKERAAQISLKAVYDFICKNPDTRLKSISIHFYLSKSNDDLIIYNNCFN